MCIYIYIYNIIYILASTLIVYIRSWIFLEALFSVTLCLIFS